MLYITCIVLWEKKRNDIVSNTYCILNKYVQIVFISFKIFLLSYRVIFLFVYIFYSGTIFRINRMRFLKIKTKNIFEEFICEKPMILDENKTEKK